MSKIHNDWRNRFPRQNRKYRLSREAEPKRTDWKFIIVASLLAAAFVLLFIAAD